jgi:hypothetical protein
VLAARAAELGAWAALVVGLELLGRELPGTDVAALGVLLLGVGPLALAAAALARRGRLPLGRALARGLARSARRIAARWTPRFEFAFRLAPEVRAGRDGILLPALLLVGAALAGVCVAPEAALSAFDALRGVSFTLTLAVRALLWAALVMVLTVGVALEARERGVPLTMLTWVCGLVASAVLPGIVFVGAALLITLAVDTVLRRKVLAPYVFCRRRRDGGVKAVRAQTLLRRAYVLALFATALVLALGHGERLLRPGVVQGAHALTAGLAVLASVPAVLLAWRASHHVADVYCIGRPPPETPLLPTLWWAGVGAAPHPVAEVREDGWELIEGPRRDPEEYDLRTPPAGSPRGLAWDVAAPRAERAFARLRRFHVVHRRLALGRLAGLWKRTRPRGGAPSATLFCPHAWLLHSLLRDHGAGAEPTGPLFETVFSRRTRRYWGLILGGLGLDVVMWDDTVAWPDLERVLRVAFECYDQRHVPVQERHFVGLPRVRVLIHRDAGPGEPPAPVRAGVPHPPVGGGARVLMVLRDRGGEGVRDEVQSPSGRRPAPQPA